MDPIINSSFNKTPMTWELIHSRLPYPSEIVMKSIFRHKPFTGPPNQFPKKKATPFTSYCTEESQFPLKVKQ